MGDSRSKPRLSEYADRRLPLPQRPAAAVPKVSGDHGSPSHHRLLPPAVGESSPSFLRRGNLSYESHETGQSDPRNWFDRSNQNPTAIFDVKCMDADPPFFQKRETESSNEEAANTDLDGPSTVPLPMPPEKAPLRHTVTQSSSADDYRSVIDDLTIENKRLREELKRYKQFGSNLMRKDKLFEIKVHGLPSNKKRELEATLRDFAASLESSTEASSRWKKTSKGSKMGNWMNSSGPSRSKHASSSSSKSRPVDSAYASGSTGPSSAFNSSSTSITRPSLADRARSSEQKVQNYLQDIPEGLYPRYLSISDKDKKKLIVRRLEQLFTGKIKGKTSGETDGASALAQPAEKDGGEAAAAGTVSNTQMSALEPAREAQMQFNLEKQSPRDNQSSNSNGGRTESVGNGAGPSGSGQRSGSGSGGRDGDGGQMSPKCLPTPEQRPTRPHDLDPDRVQVPSENLEYIRHLGLNPPELQAGLKADPRNVSIDADGWVYLNLLCNLAQLHMINVTPAFIRAAVTEKSTKFQLSPDGRKVRWRGGTDGTRFSSDSGGITSRDRSTDDDGGSDQSGGISHAGGSGGNQGKKRRRSQFGPQMVRSSTSVHYKPMFIRQSSSMATSWEGEDSSPQSMVEDSDLGNTSKWDYSGTGTSPRKRRRADGAIVYYTGAPFCTDLSGDPGEVSPTTYLTSTNAGQQRSEESGQDYFSRRTVHRTLSGSSLPVRPFSDPDAYGRLSLESQRRWGTESSVSDQTDTSDDEETDSDLPWSEHAQTSVAIPTLSCMEACGLGGVVPEDHFTIVVTTWRPRYTPSCRRNMCSSATRQKYTRPILRIPPESTPPAVVHLLTSLRTTSPELPELTESGNNIGPPVRFEYVSAQMKSLRPVSLPPAAMFFPPFSSSSSSVEDISDSDMPYSEEPDAAALSGPLYFSETPFSRYMNNPNYAYPEAADLSPNDEEDETESDDPNTNVAVTGEWRKRSRELHSAATAGGADSDGAESGYNSSIEA